MQVTVIGLTEEVQGSFEDEDLKNMKTFSGKSAGICYMKEKYFDSYITDEDKALKRFSSVANNGHMSIADHANVTVLLEECPKIVAMILNSLQCYATSEKSGRYTEMRGGDEREQGLYEKWTGKLQKLIKETYPEIDEAQGEKLARENARYFLSVFTPTTMSYTTTLRQWNYIVDWCGKIVVDLDKKVDKNYFEDILSAHLYVLSNKIREILYVEELRDNKDRHISFLTEQTRDVMGRISYKDDIIKDMYRVYYESSFAQLAQAQRHRTLKYFMQFDGNSTGTFYVPDIITDEGMISEWLDDMEIVAELIPQGMMIPVVECGYIGDFFLKCRERLCGRAQLEIAKQTESTLKRFYSSRLNFSEGIQEELRHYVNGAWVNTKCYLNRGCKEPCRWGAKEALTRKI